jgi:hypothetical protein
MKKSLRLLFAITFMAAAMAATTVSSSAPQHQLSSGGDPMPVCPPESGCLVN